MSMTLYQWAKVGHVFGFVMWVGTMVGALNIMAAHARAKAGSEFHPLEKQVGIAMDIGAALTIAFGATILFGMGLKFYLLGAGWMHTKLLLVFALTGVHGFTRVKLKKFRTTDNATLPGAVIPVTNLLALGIIILVIVRPF